MAIFGVIDKVETMRNACHILIALLLSCCGLATALAQDAKVQNKPYIDLRPLHFGVLVGLHAQDIELKNAGPQVVGEGEAMQTVVVDQDTWNPGFSVGVLADLRMGTHFNLRVSPTLHFGAKRLVYRQFNVLDEQGRPQETTQDMKNTYISVPFDLKFSAQRFNNHRPYIMAGLNPMLNLSREGQDPLLLKRFDLCLEVGLGCDFYLPYFKLIPELKFCYGLTDAVDHGHRDELADTGLRRLSAAVSGGRTKMFVLTFHFE